MTCLDNVLHCMHDCIEDCQKREALLLPGQEHQIKVFDLQGHQQLFDLHCHQTTIGTAWNMHVHEYMYMYAYVSVYVSVYVYVFAYVYVYV